MEPSIGLEETRGEPTGVLKDSLKLLGELITLLLKVTALLPHPPTPGLRQKKITPLLTKIKNLAMIKIKVNLKNIQYIKN